MRRRSVAVGLLGLLVGGFALARSGPVTSAVSAGKLRDWLISVTAPTTGQYLKFDGTEWTPTTSAGAGLSNPVTVAQGGTNASTASGARTSLGAAASGANTDITSLSTNFTGIGTTTEIDVSGNLIQSNAALEVASLDATSGTTLRDSPSINLRGEYWSGGTTNTRLWSIVHDLTAVTPTSSLVFELNGSPLVTFGQTGIPTFGSTTYPIAVTSGHLLMGTASNTVGGVAMSGDATITNGGVLTIASSAVALGTDVTGTLGYANGGTAGTSAPTAGGIAYGTGSALAWTAQGTTGQVLTSAGAGAPTWATASGGDLGSTGRFWDYPTIANLDSSIVAVSASGSMYTGGHSFYMTRSCTATGARYFHKTDGSISGTQTVTLHLWDKASTNALKSCTVTNTSATASGIQSCNFSGTETILGGAYMVTATISGTGNGGRYQAAGTAATGPSDVPLKWITAAVTTRVPVGQSEIYIAEYLSGYACCTPTTTKPSSLRNNEASMVELTYTCP